MRSCCCFGGARGALAAAILALACLPGLASAQLGYNEEDAKRIKSAEVLGALGDDLFGEQVNFYTGATSFRHTDLSIPGNHGLAVQIARSFSPEDPETAHNPVGKAFGDWELELPYIGGVFLQNVGWAVDTATPQNRCSSPTTVINLAPKGYNGFTAGMYWQGYDVVIPGQGANSLLLKFANDPNTPTTGGPWRWTTRDRVQISCLPSLQINGGTGAGYTGEGFLAVTPDGTKYWFDQMVVSQAEEIERRTTPNPITGQSQVIKEQRKEIRLYASRIEDAHGNWVTFTRTAGRLTNIASSDGRNLWLGYNAAGRITSVTDGVRSVFYTYLGGGQLGTVTYPDNSKWTFALATVAPQHYSTEPLDPYYGNWDPNSPECGWKRRLANDERVGTITHPSGATGTFTFRYQRHIRASVPNSHCSYDMLLTPTGMPSSMGNPIEEDWKFQSWTPRTFDVIALKRKQISGPGLAPMQWDYAYGAPPVAQMDYGPHTRHVTVSKPDGSQLRLTFGNRYMINDGQLQQEEVIEGGQVLQTKTLSYVTSLAGQPFPDEVGIDSRWSGDNLTSSRNRPLVQTATVRQGVTFTSLVEQFDARVRPVQHRRFSSLGYSRRDVTTYHDHLGKWILGQVAQTWNEESGQILSRTEFDPVTAAPLRFYGPGKASSPTATPATAPQLLQTVTYRADGTVATLKDALDNTTQLNDWFRGIPRGIVFADGTTRAATLDSIGRVTSTTNELGDATTYAYDAGGRLAQITWPTGDVVAWAPTQISYAQVATTEYGLGPGHWRRTESRGNYRKFTYYDALWRPVVEQEHDTANIAGTQRFSRKAYDVAGRVSFEAYPGTTATLTTGVRSFYDALGRPTRTEQDSELGALVTQYAYLPDFVTRVTNPRGYATETRFQAFEAPATDSPVKIIAALGRPEQQTTDIVKNVLGQTLSLTRSGSYGGTPMALTRHYVYDDRMRLCKRVEPETGAALFEYDAGGNVAWTAEGQALTSTSACSNASVPSSERVTRSYDARNRLVLVDYPDATPDVATTYTADGKVATLSRAPTLLSYTYNKRGLLSSERLQFGAINWLSSHSYTTLGHLGATTYPSGHQVAYAPNALGQATQAGTYATGATYHPNGALAEFTYGNGIVHTMSRNLRQLPERSRSALGANVVLDDSYDYDANGNVAAISDGLA
ncbi:RHS repeat protein, partial [Arenimonas sp. SCN 70-307]|uniref:RHS repeat domain-containing protein n=1 Tax=Arenimonas sp. SCN 70-307 TaxID=1660089 RepID=UPI000B08F2F9